MSPDQGGGGEKTEKATPKKRRDARKKGQVLKSSEVNTAVLTTTMFIVIFTMGGWMTRGMSSLMAHYLGQTGDVIGNLPQEDIATVFGLAFRDFLFIMLPITAMALIMGILVNVAQFGLLLSAEAMKPKLSKINPIQGFKKIFSMRSVVELLKSLLKIGVMTLIIYQEFIKNMDVFPGMMELSIAKSSSLIVSMAMSIAIKAAAVLIVIGLADYLYQWWEYERNLKMSKYEVKQEIKQMEGDPLIRSKRKEKQRQMSMMRMMRAIPQADVVITNPTHYAVAIRYNEAESDAPIVLAKGKDNIALKIRRIAEESRVEIVENKPVAQALYMSCEVNQRIPYDMFAAVAEILSYVYKKRHTHYTPRPAVSIDRCPIGRRA